MGVVVSGRSGRWFAFAKSMVAYKLSDDDLWRFHTAQPRDLAETPEAGGFRNG